MTGAAEELNMLKRIVLSSCVAAAAGLALPALAADLDQVIYAPDIPVAKPVEIGTGWYLRGDLGYSFKTRGAARNYSVFTPGPPQSYSTSAFATSELDSDYTASIGFGYQFTDFLRADLTFDYSNGSFDGTTAAAVPCPGMPVGTTCASTDTADFKSYGFLANGYVDLGTYAGVTPYLGAGAGITRVAWDPLSNTARCVAGGAACPAVGTLAPVSHGGETSWRFTYALMAGFSYDVTKNLKLDLGYRYSKIAGGDMFRFDAATAAAGAAGVQARDRGFERHEVRAGLRYALW